MKSLIRTAVIVTLLAGVPGTVFAQQTAANIIRQGLLGAGTGAIAGAASGGKSNKLWISALTGAGVNILGGSLLDMITNKGTTAVRTPVRRISPGRTIYYGPALPGHTYNSDYAKGYQEGYKNGYLAGYKEAVREMAGSR